MSVTSMRDNGYIYQETYFNGIDGTWELSPNTPTRVNFSLGQMTLKHGTTPLRLFFSYLTNTQQFVLDVKNVYNPKIVGDEGGIIVYKSDTDYFTITEYFNSAEGTTQSYPWIRLIRDYNNYYAYWSDDGVVWNSLGVMLFDQAPKIGLYVDGTTGDDLVIEQIRIYKSTKLVIDNLGPGYVAQLLDTSGNIVNSQTCRYGDSSVSFDMSGIDLPLNGKIAIVNGTTTFSQGSNYPMWGGDRRSFEVSTDLEYKDEKGNFINFDGNIENFLGYLNSGSNDFREIELRVSNTHTGSFSNITVGLTDYKGTSQYQTLVKLASDNNGTPGVYGSSITIPTLAPGQTKTVWLKCNRETNPALITSQIYFAFNITSTYSY